MAIPAQVLDAAKAAEEQIAPQDVLDDEFVETDKSDETIEMPNLITQNDLISQNNDLHTQLAASHAQLGLRVGELEASKKSADTEVQAPIIIEDVPVLRAKIKALSRLVEEKKLSFPDYEEQKQDILDKIHAIRKIADHQEVTHAVTKITSEDRFWTDLNRLVPNWQSEYADPAFTAWLTEEEGMSGLTRANILQDAREQFNSAQVARIFTSFNATKPTTQFAPSKSVPAHLISPGKPKGGVSLGTEQGKIYSSAEIMQMATNLTRGIPSDPKQRAAMLAEIDRAHADGRVR